ncbi:MAG TPA: membrane dipeptidase [Anaerolineae bacterium]|nr:membrane dipeptidase [Anaerolineae bacterium]HIP71797.1 membrane dipeptidase [Anaerolineae bacterium]
MTNPAQFHQENIIIDGLNASHFPNPAALRRLVEGGVTAVNATIAAWHNPTETINQMAEIYRLFREHDDLIMQVTETADIFAAKKNGRTGLILGFQDTAPLGDNLDMLAVYRRLGVRIIQLTYNFENLVGFGCQAPEDKGLTDFGREVVAEMNRLGILIDLSHCGPQTTLDAIELSQTPVAITHANAYAQFPHPRNKTDEAIRALAAKGGVIGALSFPAMLTQNLPATLDDYLDAVDYLVNLVGVDHVGLGPDFMEEMTAETMAIVLDGLPPDVVALLTKMPPVQDFASVADMPNVTRGLLERGYSKSDARQIIGGNWLRLYEEVWAAR